MIQTIIPLDGCNAAHQAKGFVDVKAELKHCVRTKEDFPATDETRYDSITALNKQYPAMP